jgi:PAS domain S-box-containing protein
MLSSTGKILAINIKASEDLGYDLNEIIGKPLEILINDAEHVLKQDDSNELTKEINIRANNNTLYPVEYTTFQSGKSKILIFRRRTNRVNRLYDQQKVQFSAQLGSWDYDRKTRSFDWSEETYRIFGKDPSRFIPNRENVIECVHPDDRRFVNRVLDETARLPELKYRIIHGITGQERWVYQKHWHIDNTKNAGDTTLTGVIQDITASETLLKEYAKFYHAVKFARNPLIITDKKGRITFLNQQCEKIYGYDLTELQEKSIWILNGEKEVYLDNGYSETQYEKLFAEMKRDLFIPQIGCWEGELINKTRDGEIRWVRSLIHTLRDKKGKIEAFVFTSFDITEERKQEEHVRIEIYDAIASVAEHRDNETGKHMKRIGEFSYLIAKKLGKSRRFSDDMRIFAPMHDIGKVGIADEILMAPRLLTKEEFEIMKTHTTIGYDILKGRSKLEMAAEIAENHHEKYDGTGYPKGISGKGIPLSARICSIVDVYDALRSKRPYKEAFSEEKTFEIIAKGSGTHFDPLLVKLLFASRSSLNTVFNELKD